jgi:ABC-type maltose transport system permease subunit
MRAAGSSKIGRPALITIPVLVMFLALQRRLVRGIASAGVRG